MSSIDCDCLSRRNNLSNLRAEGLRTGELSMTAPKAGSVNDINEILDYL